jgi:hypothetical protein
MEEQPVKPLAVVERYDQFINYIYPITQNIPRKHGRFRDSLLDNMLQVPERIYDAAKVGQISKVHALDAALASLRWKLRFAARPDRKLITRHQHEVASVHLAEVGKMVGAWKKKFKR